MIYERALLHAKPVNPWRLGNGPRRLSLQLLRVNKTVHSEASSIFYGRNCFDLTNRHSGSIVSFLERIRPQGASQIEHVRVRLMVFLVDMEGHDGYLLDIFNKLQSCCPNLRTLTGLPHYLTDLFDCNDPPFRRDIVRHKLALVRTKINLFMRLEEVVVEISRASVRDTIKRELDKYGWRIKYVEPLEGEYPESLYDDSDEYGLYYDDSDDYDSDL
nr:hypothetical protein CFP56_13344 [Quercus suber]